MKRDKKDRKDRKDRKLEILEHGNNKIVGTFTASRSFGFVDADDVHIKDGIYIPQKAFNGAVTGQKVVTEITQWPHGKKKAEGKIVKILGMAGKPGVDILSIMSQYDLTEEFPEAVQQEAGAIPQTVAGQEQRGRVDRRHLHIVTVDGEDARDLDDGVYAEENEDGTYFLGVYIADVSYYVRENSPLDREARERGTSVYLVDRVIPMLPKELSNGICSLNAGVDRFSMACEMIIGRDGQVKKYDIFPAIIHVHRRLTYTMVNSMLVDKDAGLRQDNRDIIGMLETLERLHGSMKKYRHRRGSIGFNVPEIKVKLDEKGRPISLMKREDSLGESIIEQCMLAANETVAEHMFKRRLPFMYRVHEEPDSEKLGNLNSLLMTFGIGLHRKSDGSVVPRDIQQVLEGVSGRPEEKLISSVALRSMQQARYSADSLGHFGLAAKYYTHFTSPIRRYPDLIVHRLLRESFGVNGISKNRQEKLRSVLPEIADHASVRERLATEAERATTDLKKVEYMQQFIGDTFTGIISGVTSFGIFVELENGAEGLVRAASLIDDYYDYVESRYELYGQRRHRSYRLGDEVEVVLTRADTEARNIDFVVKDNCARGSLIGLNRDDAENAEKSFVKKPKRNGILAMEAMADGEEYGNRKKSKSRRAMRAKQGSRAKGRNADKQAKGTIILNGGYGANHFGSSKRSSAVNGKKKRSHKNSLRKPQGKA